MLNVDLVDFNRNHFEEMKSWFKDEELADAMSCPDENWYNYLQYEEVTVKALVDEQGQLIGEIQMDRDPDGLGHIAITIKPELQNQGYGAAALEAFVTEFSGIVNKFVSYIHKDNSASKQLFENLGFQSEGQFDDDGFLAYGRAS